MKRKRLLRLRKIIEAVPPQNFDMTRWASEGFIKNGPTCGMAFCAGGHACLDEKFNKLGLKFKTHPYGEIEPRYKGRNGTTALHKFFEIDFDSALILFAGYDGDDSKEKVIHNINLILTGETPRDYEDASYWSSWSSKRVIQTPFTVNQWAISTHVKIKRLNDEPQ